MEEEKDQEKREKTVCVCVGGGVKDEANRYARTPTAASVTKHTQTIRST